MADQGKDGQKGGRFAKFKEYLQSFASAVKAKTVSTTVVVREPSTPSASGNSSDATLGLALVFLGLIYFGVKQFFPELVTIHFAFSLGLFLLAGYAAATKAGEDKIAVLIPMLLFSIWYFIYGSPFNIIVLIILVITLSVPVVLTKGKCLRAVAWGFLAVLFFFLDIGSLAFLIERFHLPLTLFMEGAVLYVPWWSLFGIITLPAQSSSNSSINFIVNALRILAILYVVFVFIIPIIPNIGYETSLLPVAGEIAAAQQRLQERVGKQAKPLTQLWWNIGCILSDTAKFQECIKRKREQSEVEALCTEKGFAAGTSQFLGCVEKELKARKDAALSVSGAVDVTILEPTTAKFVISEDFFPKLVLKKQGEATTTTYPVNLEIKNPRQQQITVDLSCFFKKGTEAIAGEITLGEGGSSLVISNKVNQFAAFCKPPLDLQGKYNLQFQASLKNLKTPSSLKRVFIGDKTEEEKAELVAQISKGIFPTRNDALSKAPAEFVRLNFGFGATPENPFIDADDNVIFSSSLENIGTGKLGRVIAYKINLEERGFMLRSGDPRCLQGAESDVLISKSSVTKTYALPTCFLELPEDLKHPTLQFVPETFVAEVLYDYIITKETPIEVRVIPDQTVS